MWTQGFRGGGLAAFDENAVFADEGNSTAGWSGSAGTMSSAGGYVRVTKDASGAPPALATKTASFVDDDRDWIMFGKFRASRAGASDCGAIWFLNNGDPISPDANSAIWYGSTNASTGGYTDTALSIVGTTSGGTVRHAASLGTGYAYDSVPVEFALHFDNKWSTLTCYLRQTDGTWLWKARVSAEFFSPPNIQMAIASTAPAGAYVEADYLQNCRPNIIVMSDSIGEGKTGFSPDPALALTDPTSSWQHYAKAFPGLRNNLCVNKGVGSQSSTQIQARMTTDALNHGPRVVVLHASTNDTVASVSLATRTSNIQSGVDAILGAGAQCVLLNAMYGTSSNSLNPGLRDYMLEWWTDYRPTLSGVAASVDIMTPIISGGYMSDSLTQSDKIHPTPTGHATYAPSITAALT